MTAVKEWIKVNMTWFYNIYVFFRDDVFQGDPQKCQTTIWAILIAILVVVVLIIVLSLVKKNVTKKEKEIVAQEEQQAKEKDEDLLNRLAALEAKNEELSKRVDEIESRQLKILASQTQEEKAPFEVTREMVMEYVANMTGDQHPAQTVVNERSDNKRPDSLNVKSCNMALVYGQNGKLSCLIRLASENVDSYETEESAFAGTNDYYKVKLASLTSQEDFESLLEDSYAYILSKYFKVENGEYVEVEPQEEVEAPTEDELEEAVVEETPVVEEAPVAPVAAADDEDEDSAYVSKYKKSFEAKLIQSDDKIKKYYSDIKNALLAKKGVKARMSFKHEVFKANGQPLVRLQVKGKTLYMWTALELAKYEETVWHLNESKLKAFGSLHKVRSPRKAGYALEMVAELTKDMAENTKYTAVDYVAQYPYEEDEALIEKGLIKIFDTPNQE